MKREEQKNHTKGNKNVRHTQNGASKSLHRRRLTKDELIKRENDRRRAIDERIKRENDRKRYLDDDMQGSESYNQSLNDRSNSRKRGSRGNGSLNSFDEENVNPIFDSFNRLKKGAKSVKSARKFRKRIFKGIGLFILILFIINIISIFRFFGAIKNTVDTAPVYPGFSKPCNILVLGMDIGAVGHEDNNAIKRTDTMMVVNYNPKTKATKIISIPRDTLVTENKSRYKINAAYVRGQDKKAKEVVENILKVTINYTVKINYAAFRNLIDSIGGVDMEIERDMIYDDDGQNLHINFKGGTTVHLDGKKAEEFFRWRKNNDGTGLATGDLGRIENQHKFLQKVVKKFASPLTIIRMPKILGAVGENVETNMGAFSMINYGFKFALHKNKIEMTTLKGVPKMIGGQSYLVLDENLNKDLIESLK